MASFFPDTNAALAYANKGYLASQKVLVGNFLQHLIDSGADGPDELGNFYTFAEALADLKDGTFDADVARS